MINNHHNRKIRTTMKIDETTNTKNIKSKLHISNGQIKHPQPTQSSDSHVSKSNPQYPAPNCYNGMFLYTKSINSV